MGFGYHGVDWKTADAVMRARVQTELSRAAFPQYVRLFTCNRSEIYCYDAARQGGSDLAALTHLFAVASGLESMVLGEYQILGQVKEAYREALAAGTVGKELDRIFRDAISCAKRVKTELDLGAVSPSVCRAGLELVDARVGLKGRRVFVIGSGKTGTLAVKIAVEKGAVAVSACNRSPERAQHLACDYGVRLVDYADRYAEIARSDVVISATASPHVVVARAKLTQPYPCCFLDLAAPHDVEASVAELPGTSVVTIETIGELACGDRDERAALVATGLAIVREAAEKTAAWLVGQAAASDMV